MDQLLEFISNNTLLAAGTVAMALAVIFNELRIKADGLTALPPSQVVRLINGGAKVIDIRDKEAYAKGHIVDSVNIPAADLAGEIDPKLKKAKSVVLVCDSGGRTAPLVTTLRKKGLEAVFGLQGGLGAWRRDNLPVVSSKDG